MPSQITSPQIALPIPRRRSPLLTNESFGQDLSLLFSNTKTKSAFTLATRDHENDYAPPAPPPPSPVNFPMESWSTACAIRRWKEEEEDDKVESYGTYAGPRTWERKNKKKKRNNINNTWWQDHPDGHSTYLGRGGQASRGQLITQHREEHAWIAGDTHPANRHAYNWNLA
jgi:hypothetical protein